MFFGDSGGAWAVGSIASDAEFLFIRRHNREISSLAFCSATFIEVEGLRVFSAPDRVKRFKWTSGAGAFSDPESLKYFHGELIRPGTPVR
jgi:hypothetical protein